MPEGFTASGRMVNATEVTTASQPVVVAEAQVPYHLQPNPAHFSPSGPSPWNASDVFKPLTYEQLRSTASILKRRCQVLEVENAQLQANLAEYRVECEKLRRRVPIRSED